MANKSELYVGMTVRYCGYDYRFQNTLGTIIDLECSRDPYDCLVEFDEDVNGHSGLGWGKVVGEPKRCYWFCAQEIEEVILNSIPAEEMGAALSFDELMSGGVS